MALGKYREVCEIAETCWGVLTRRKRYPVWERVYRQGLAGALADQNPVIQARMRLGLALLHLEISRELGALREEMNALAMLADVADLQGRSDVARGYRAAAVEIEEDLTLQRNAIAA